MKSLDVLVKELIGSDSEPIKANLPKAFYDRLVLIGRRRFGTLPKAEVAQKALVHAAAVGLIIWEKSLKPKGIRKPKTKAEKKAK